MAPYPLGCPKIDVPSIWSIPLIMFSYLMSCAIVMAYNKKFKKVKKKK